MFIRAQHEIKHFLLVDGSAKLNTPCFCINDSEAQVFEREMDVHRVLILHTDRTKAGLGSFGNFLKAIDVLLWLSSNGYELEGFQLELL
jgi:hypothetical protein